MDEPRRYDCKLLRVVDGDTFVTAVDLGFEVYVHQTVRLARVDTPEMNTSLGRQAKVAVVEWFGDPTQVHTLLSYSAKDKYGRRVCDVQHGVSGEILSEWLLLNGIAVPWPKALKIKDLWRRDVPADEPDA